MNKWWGLWWICIPLFFLSYGYSISIASKIAYLPQSECKPKFIFTPQDVQYCSDIYAIDVVLIALKTNPIMYISVLTGLYLTGFIVYVSMRNIRKRKSSNGRVR
ncbi:hypothetical protein IMZ31_20300 (plasmid) [Pontibacillus sp. ALD_SL1]|uniref:hypothetical protein n=1 Tax=Pontibacillus sp. ALD_SL1 TaxID=2777185 RepID=UPI001A97172B|nr:hypothetical protein [Pontibacillus sp. ALD_SL1]QST02892.1 hypothetical protein IMZ31_20300 [Pontibacillus sp. ALD_SL1]